MRSAKALSSTAPSIPAFSLWATSAFNLNSCAKSIFATASALARFGQPPPPGTLGSPFPPHPATVIDTNAESDNTRRNGLASGCLAIMSLRYHLPLLCQFFAMTDHDQQFQRVGHSNIRRGRRHICRQSDRPRGGCQAAFWNGLQPARSGRYGAHGYPDDRSGSENLTQ